MAHIFKPRITRYVDSSGKRVNKEAPGSRKLVERATKWYGKYLDANGVQRRVSLCTDKEAAHAMLHQIVRAVDRKQAGLVDPYEEHQKRPLAEHLHDYKRYLESKGNTPHHINDTIAQIAAVIGACHYTSLSDLEASPVAEYLARRRQGALSNRSSNAYTISVKGFCRWLAREHRLRDNPLNHLQAVHSHTDIRVNRRALTPDQSKRLLTATQQSRAEFRGLSGPDRAMLYTVALHTGLRASELASLSARSIQLDSSPPTITVEAAYSKRRRRDLQPIPGWLAERLRPWLGNRFGAEICSSDPASPPANGDHAGAEKVPDPETKLWPGTWSERAAAMLRRDLQAAGIPYKDDRGRQFDFHALRHQFISNLASAGVHPKVAQQLARHSTISLTMDRYTHVELADLAGALDLLPRLGTESAALAEAGAPQTGPVGSSLVVPMVVPTPDLPCPQESPPDSVAASPEEADGVSNTLQARNLDSSCRSESAHDSGAGGRARTDNLLITNLWRGNS